MASHSGPKRPSRSGQDEGWGVGSVGRNQDPKPDLEGRERDVRDYWNRREPAVGTLAARQNTLITHEQLVAIGVKDGAIHSALRRKRLYPRHRGVYSIVPPLAMPPLAREHGAVLACGPGAYLSHHSAAAVWGIRPPQRPGTDVDVTVVRRDAGRRRDGINVRRTAALDRRDVRRHEGIPIVSAARALLDIAPDLAARDAERACDEALVRNLTTLAAVNAMLDRYPRRRGTQILRELTTTGRHATVTQSEAEERMLALLRKGKIRLPEVNVKVGRYRADFYWRAEGVIVEIDGYRFHRGRAAFERDHERDAEHQAMGLLVIRITWRQLQREPEAVLVLIAGALAARAQAA
jgi:very-short-patch-repair endonuclease